MAKMKHLKSYESLRFNFEGDPNLEREETELMDRKGIFLEYEQEFLEEVGLEYVESPRSILYQTTENNVTIQVIKFYNNNKNVCYYSASIYGNTISEYIQLPIDSYEKDKRILILNKLIRGIYIALNLTKRKESIEQKRIERTRRGIERPNVAKAGEGDWWNVENET